MSHLDYYIRHNISPVRYDLGSLRAHFQRRHALYRTLGLLPLMIRGANVLEVAAGTGQNSVYLASLLPARLTLLEPNPAGLRSIRECYKGLSLPHTKPEIIESRLESYEPEQKFDIVICENWLGASSEERALLKKLAGMVAVGGVLVVTCVSPIGFLPNVVRRALAVKLTGQLLGFDDKTRVLVEAFSPHLASLSSMTRSAVDWVHDNMLNPVYFDLCLTIPMVVSDLGEQFQAVGVSPDIRRDWRWFKSLHGSDFEFNKVLVDEYYRNYRSFLDYRHVYDEAQAVENKSLEDAILSLIGCVREFDEACARLEKEVLVTRSRVVAEIERVRGLLEGFAAESSQALREAADLLNRESVTISDVAQLRFLQCWFGRETMYISLERVDKARAVT